eukprot:scpid12718/ scgid33772/ 
MATLLRVPKKTVIATVMLQSPDRAHIRQEERPGMVSRTMDAGTTSSCPGSSAAMMFDRRKTPVLEPRLQVGSLSLTSADVAEQNRLPLRWGREKAPAPQDCLLLRVQLQDAIHDAACHR